MHTACAQCTAAPGPGACHSNCCQAWECETEAWSLVALAGSRSCRLDACHSVCYRAAVLLYVFDHVQEIVGLGLANFAGSAFNAYSTTGSFSRSAVNYDSGEHMQPQPPLATTRLC